MTKKIIENGVLVGILMSILVSGMLIGTPLKMNNILIIEIWVNLLAIIYYSYKIIKKEKIINNYFDYFIIFLSLSSFIPVIFNKYYSLNNSLKTSCVYITVMNGCICVSSIFKNNKNVKKYIVNTIIIIAVILTIIGIEKMTTNNVSSLEIMNITTQEYDEVRMDSSFGYPNSFAGIIGLSIFLVMGEFLNCNNKKTKYLFLAVFQLLMIALILTYSRLMYIIFGIASILYLLFVKNKELKKQSFLLLMVSGLIALIYSNIYMSCVSLSKYVLIWISLIISIIINGAIVFIVGKFISKIKKIKVLDLIFCLVIILFFIVIFTICTIGIPKQVLLFNKENNSKTYTKIINNVSGGQEYLLKFDIESKCKKEENSNETNNFEIGVIQKNKYFKEIRNTTISFNSFIGLKKMKINLDEETTELYVVFTSKKTNQDTYLKINKMFINEKEKIIEYKYLPTKVVEKVLNLNFKTKSVWERVVFITDGLKIIKNNWLFGIGGDCWKIAYSDVQEYNYGTDEPHSYPNEVFMEFGIIAFVLYCGIIIIYIKRILEQIKEQDVSQISILFAIGIILVHSVVDFDMSFFYIIYVVYILLELAQDKNIRTNYCISSIIKILLIVVSIGCLYFTGVSYVFNNSLNNIIKKDDNEKKNILNKYERLLPFSLDIKREKAYILSVIDKQATFKLIEDIMREEPFQMDNSLKAYYAKENINDINKSNFSDYLYKIELLYNQIITTEKLYTYDDYYQVERMKDILNMADILVAKGIELNNTQILEWAKKYYVQLQNEIDFKKERLMNYEKVGYAKEYVFIIQQIINEFNTEIDNQIKIIEESI